MGGEEEEGSAAEEEAGGFGHGGDVVDDAGVGVVSSVAQVFHGAEGGGADEEGGGSPAGHEFAGEVEAGVLAEDAGVSGAVIDFVPVDVSGAGAAAEFDGDVGVAGAVEFGFPGGEGVGSGVLAGGGGVESVVGPKGADAEDVSHFVEDDAVELVVGHHPGDVGDIELHGASGGVKEGHGGASG